MTDVVAVVEEEPARGARWLMLSLVLTALTAAVGVIACGLVVWVLAVQLAIMLVLIVVAAYAAGEDIYRTAYAEGYADAQRRAGRAGQAGQ